MSAAADHTPTAPGNARRRALIVLAVASILTHAALAAQGDLRDDPAPYLAVHGLLLVLMVAAYRLAREGGGSVLRIILLAALAFRMVAAWGGPVLSDDLYRYVWDGRVQVEGVHPYRHAPADPALGTLRDADVFPRINHPEVPTIYPPLAQWLFAALAFVGAGPAGFQVAMGLIDMGVVLALLALLRALRWPVHRVVLYAWNPLAVVESAGSGHVEPLGVLLVVLAVGALVAGRAVRAGAALGLAIQAKLLPLVLVPGALRRMRGAGVAAMLAAVAIPWLPYALTGPAVGGGTFAYAERWERNASVYAGVHAIARQVDTAAVLKPRIDRLKERLGDDALDWDFWYRHVWPRDVARATVAALALPWLVWLAFRRGLDPVRESLWAIGGVLLLAPTVHPWYLLWVAPLAAAVRSPAWLAWCALVPLAYLDAGGDVPGWVRGVQYGVVLVAVAVEGRRTLRVPPPGRPKRPGGVRDAATMPS